MAPTPHEDKRAFKRIRRQFVIRVGVADPKNGAPIWSMVSTHNFSAGGALFTLDQSVEEGEQLLIKIHFLERVIDCKARVVHFDLGFQKPLINVGIVFEALQDTDREFIEYFCDHFKG